MQLRLDACLAGLIDNYIAASVEGFIDDGVRGAVVGYLDQVTKGALGVGVDAVKSFTTLLTNPPSTGGDLSIRFAHAAAYLDVSGTGIGRKSFVQAIRAHQYALTGVQDGECVFEGNNFTGALLPAYGTGNPCDVLGRSGDDARLARTGLATLLETPPRRYVCQWWDETGAKQQRDGWLYSNRTIPGLGAYDPDWDKIASDRARNGSDMDDVYTDEERDIAKNIRVPVATGWLACLTDDGKVRQLHREGEEPQPKGSGPTPTSATPQQDDRFYYASNGEGPGLGDSGAASALVRSLTRSAPASTTSS